AFAVKLRAPFTSYTLLIPRRHLIAGELDRPPPPLALLLHRVDGEAARSGRPGSPTIGEIESRISARCDVGSHFGGCLVHSSRPHRPQGENSTWFVCPRRSP